MLDAATLIQRAEAYCDRHRIAESTLGRRAVNDGKLLNRLRAGRTITLETARRLEAFLDQPVPEPQPSEAAE